MMRSGQSQPPNHTRPLNPLRPDHHARHALYPQWCGLAVDPSARVLSSITHKPISWLWAAGEVIGGVHGRNRLAGLSLLEAVVFGRGAGTGAA
ncbi:hypothetical protein C8R45DRAFT_289468 [Mycena sanguinolenta]|nr:hypothetical protein C8R45DRAFT_289468 [Mycena sanguinolenta]